MKHSDDNLRAWFQFHVNVDSRILYLGNDANDAVTESEEGDPGINYEMSRRFIKGLSYLDSLFPKGGKDITVIVNSVGGDVIHGLAIYDAICHSPSFVAAIIIGQASSITSIIAQAADYIIISPNAFMMLHDGDTGYGGHHNTIKNTLKFETEFLHKRMYDIYYDKINKAKREDLREILNPKLPTHSKKISTKLTQEHIASLCQHDNFFTPEECVKLKLANRLMKRGDMIGCHLNEKVLPNG